MNLIEAITWSCVELKSPKPDLKAIQTALDKALLEAARLEVLYQVRTHNLARMARAMGGPSAND